jgi:hypothetical protein
MSTLPLPGWELGLATCLLLLVGLALSVSRRLDRLERSYRHSDDHNRSFGEETRARLAGLEEFRLTLDLREVRRRDEDLLQILQSLLAYSRGLQERDRNPPLAGRGIEEEHP